ncbi:hypothetical protein BLNAU_10760 [Blattamonas nauphoetae]|uniref:Uncharacterized protein n=1 Tax=Blattamonas nauphoetae TaxID=2049346 RepID=A0ABQ9XPA8_9EUKA|nr:hypothetical protein BLNAU_10760 [Blattamonas nauphoetae]
MLLHVPNHFLFTSHSNRDATPIFVTTVVHLTYPVQCYALSPDVSCEPTTLGWTLDANRLTLWDFLPTLSSCVCVVSTDQTTSSEMTLIVNLISWLPNTLLTSTLPSLLLAVHLLTCLPDGLSALPNMQTLDVSFDISGDVAKLCLVSGLLALLSNSLMHANPLTRTRLRDVLCPLEHLLRVSNQLVSVPQFVSQFRKLHSLLIAGNKPNGMGAVYSRMISSTVYSCPDCSPFLKWRESKRESESEKAVVFRSLVATVKLQPALDGNLERKAVRFLKYVGSLTHNSTDAFLGKFASFAGGSLTDFTQSIVNCSAAVQLTLIKADLIPQVINSLTPQSVSFAEGVDIHNSLMNIIQDSLCLATPDGRPQLKLKDENEQQGVQETQNWNKAKGAERQMWKIVQRMLRMEGFDDVTNQKQLNDRNTDLGRWIVGSCLELDKNQTTFRTISVFFWTTRTTDSPPLPDTHPFPLPSSISNTKLEVKRRSEHPLRRQTDSPPLPDTHTFPLPSASPSPPTPTLTTTKWRMMIV